MPEGTAATMTQTQRFILVYRKTRLAELVERFNTLPQARFYLEQSGADFTDYQAEDRQYRAVLNDARTVLAAHGPVQMLERGFLPSYRFYPADILIVIGQDGLVANTLKYLSGNPVIAINPDPQRWDGLLLPFHPNALQAILTEVLKGGRTRKVITLAQATTNDGQSLLAVNDLFIGPKSHTSARYELCWGDQREVQSSSGIIVSTGLGSTGWLQSLLAGARGIAGHSTTLEELEGQGFAWDAGMLMYIVREPFPSQKSGTALVMGVVDEHHPLAVESRMPEHGVIFSDGIESDYLTFNAGSTVHIGLSRQKGQLVV